MDAPRLLAAALLAFAKGYSMTQGKGFPTRDVILAAVGIAGAVGIWAAALFRGSANQGPEHPGD